MTILGGSGLIVSPIAGPAGPIGPIGPAGPASPAILSFGANAVAITTTTRYLYPWYEDNLAPLNSVQYIIPVACTLRDLYVRHNVPGGNGNNIIYTIRKNSIPSALSVILASTAVSASNLINTIAFAAGDLLDLEITKPLGIGASPNDIIATCRMVP